MNTASLVARRTGAKAVAIAFAIWGGIAVANALGAPVVLAATAIAASLILAWNAPAATLSLFFFCLLAIDRDLQSLLPDDWKMLSVRGASLRYSDPLLAAMALTSAIRGYGTLATRAGPFDRAEVWTWAFVAILGVYAAMGVPAWGIAAPGEMRTYYGVALVIGYILASVREEATALKCWRALYWLAVALIGVSIWRGWALHGLAIGPETRWMTAHTNLAVVMACVVPLFLPRDGWPGTRPWTAWAIGGFVLLLTLINPHRSVWLAGTLSFAAILFAGGLSFRRLAAYAGWTALVTAVSAVVITAAGYDLGAFLAERLTPFTSGFYNDANSAWRLGLWLEAILKVDRAQAWVLGLGFGEHFGIIDLAGDLIRTSPHNAYITVYYHLGLFGLAFSLLWLANLAWGGHRPGGESATVLMNATLAGSLGFAMAYPFPVFGLALVALAAAGAKRCTPGREIDPACWTPDALAGLGREGTPQEREPDDGAS